MASHPDLIAEPIQPPTATARSGNHVSINSSGKRVQSKTAPSRLSSSIRAFRPFRSLLARKTESRRTAMFVRKTPPSFARDAGHARHLMHLSRLVGALAPVFDWPDGRSGFAND